MHVPVHGTLTIGGWTIELLLEQRNAIGAPLEAVFVDTVHGRVRLAVVDPAVNPENPLAETLAATAWGALTTALRTATSPENALLEANGSIRDNLSTEVGWASGPMLCVAVADLHPLEPLLLGAARAGDSEVHGDGFALAGECFTTECRSRLRDAKSGVHPADPARWRIQRTNTSADDYLSTPIGLLPQPKLETWGPTRTTHVSLCTDGATGSRTLDDMLGDCRAPVTGAHAYPHPDRARLDAFWAAAR